MTERDAKLICNLLFNCHQLLVIASKCKVITLETKYQIVTAVDANKQYKKQIADEFGISPSTLSIILKSKDKILEAYHSSDFDSARKKLRTADYKDVENALFEWFKTFCGESESVNSDVLDDYVTPKLLSLLIGYQPRDVFNIDETELFYKLLPNRTLALKGEECHSGKHSKERITLLVGSNMDGTEKLKLLVIGNAKQPRCFKGVKALPVDYEGNTKAWMTGDIFKDWVIKFDRKMQQQKRKAGFVISGQTTDSDLVNYPPPHLSGEEDDDDEEDNLPLSALKIMWLEVQSKLQMSKNINLDDYVDVDTEVVIAEKLTDDDIVVSVQQKHSGQPEEDSEDEDEDEGTDLPKTR
nr:PREDICTED: tigger transposable element-derived protein 4-like [Latimeria chalumnae]|eukprot:XP_014351091.1 PREDICTED: tigger transposable element-derived protein 4-like [Latimeria chalumnae]